MLSPEEKQEKLFDARDPLRREAFRRAKGLQEWRSMSGQEYFAFLRWMQTLFIPACNAARPPSGPESTGRFLL
jgi:hypothetical protein